MNTDAAVVAIDLRFSYPDSREVITGINFEISRTERVGLIGPNGSGKTTVLLMLCGMLKPESGNVTVNGKMVTHITFNPEINYLFQFPDDQLFCATVFDDVIFGPLNMHLEKDEVRQRAGGALKAVGCTHLADKAPHHLSGGEKRMVAIATILSMMPDIILFDEPVSNLDSRNRRRVIRTITDMRQTVIVASHDLELLLETCTRVLLVDEGRLVQDGPVREILSDEKLLKAHGMEKPHSLIPHSHL
jgi:cobalt/nickel transport system ATP-binding protein